MKNLLLLTAFLLGMMQMSFAQGPKTGPYRLPVQVVGKDTLPVYAMEPTAIEQELDAQTLKSQEEWNKYLRRVRYVWPLANACADKLQDIQARLAQIDKHRDEKKFLNEEENKLRDEYASKLKDLSYYQAAILIKLIGRQTGHTPYFLIKDYKSGVSAFAWKTLAKIYGLDLNEEYDPARNPDLERALQQLGYQ